MIKQSNQHPKNQRSHFLKYFAFLSAFIFVRVISFANTYYVSSSTGSDAYSITQAQNQTSPWQSITKLNSILNTLSSGDVILFKSGDTFYGTLTTPVSGITFGAYGSGAKPVITGLTTISSWTSLGGNIWEAAVPGGLSTLNMVVINGILTPMGRYPNANAINGGYLTYESFSGSSSITDNQLSSSPNWTGGDVLIRRNNWASTRSLITNHTGNIISYTSSATSSMDAGYGYFIEKHLSTLDQNGEWFYDATTKKIKIYYTAPPPSIQVATLTNLVNMVYTSGTTKSNIILKGISFKGCEGVMMSLAYCNNITIDNCDLSFAGINAIEYGNNVTYLTIQNSTISDANMDGIYESSSYLTTNVTIQNNIIKRIGINPGMITSAGYSEGDGSVGIVAGSLNLTIKQNIIDSIGYNGIGLKQNKNNTIVSNNIISNFCSVKNDGGGIYNSGQRGLAPATNVIISNNIISKAVGAIGGTTSSLYDIHARAIYIDATSQNVQVLNNTIFDTWEGIYMSQSQNITIRGNTVYNTGNYKPGLNYYSGALSINDAFDGYMHVSNNTITNNIFFAKKTDQLLWLQTDRFNGVGNVGIVDSNYYANPQNDFPFFLTNTTASSLLSTYSLKSWHAKYPAYDSHSKGSPISIPANTVVTIGSNKCTNGTFSSNTTGWVAGSSPTVHTFEWDNTSKITGTGSAKLTGSVTSTNTTFMYIPVGAVVINKNYVLRFKTKATKLGSFSTYMQKWLGDYTGTTDTYHGSIDTAVQQHEIIITWNLASQTNAAVFLRFSQDSGTTYVDDVELYEATVTPTNIDDYVRFEYNPTNTERNISLPNVYVGADGTVYKSGSIMLQPYTSKILIKDTSQVIKSATAPPPATLTAVSSAGTITTVGGTTNLKVTASGGTPPYTGTGNFTVKAGTYNILVKDSLGASTTTSITINDPVATAPLSASSTAGIITTIGGTTTLTVTTAGGTPPYTGTGNFTVKAGYYNILVKDSLGASTTTSITISDPVATALLSASSTAGIITTVGGTTTLTVAASGGTPPYSGTGNFTVKAGYYNILVKDSKGASTTTSITITESGTARLATGNVDISALDSSGFLNSTTQSLTPLASIPELKLSIYPNPSSAEFRLIVDGGNNEIIGVTVLSADGKVVYNLSGRSGNSFRFGRDWAPGLYIIRVSQTNIIKTIKAIKS